MKKKYDIEEFLNYTNISGYKNNHIHLVEYHKQKDMRRKSAPVELDFFLAFMEGYTIWLKFVIASVICWVFHTLDVVGEVAVNPFEGGANDIPVTQISLIKIDMRDMLDEKELPEPIVAKNNILI